MEKSILIALLGCAFYLNGFEFGIAEDDTASLSADRSAAFYRLIGNLCLMLAAVISLLGT